MIKYALSLVLRRKLRTFLTSLGITISVVLMSFILFGMNGLSNIITGELNSRFLPNQLVVTNQSFDFGFMPPQPEDSSEEKDPTFITPALIEDLLENPSIEGIDPQINLLGYELEIVDQTKRPYPNAFGFGLTTTEDKAYILDYKGDKFIPEDNEAIVGNSVANYYGLTPEEIIGKELVMRPSTASLFSQRSVNLIDKEYRFEIIGYADAGTDRFDMILNIEKASEILADVSGATSGQEYLDLFGFDQLFIDAVEEDVSTLKDSLVEEYGFNVVTAEDIRSLMGQITFALTVGLALFGVIAAIVASIGIINTMIMSIYEQTREIGIIKAIGASDFQVMIIFITQSAVIGLIGAVIGQIIVIVGMLAAEPEIVKELQAQGLQTDQFFVVDLGVVALIILISIIVGILAGLYPSLKAARLDPVKALRYE